MLNTIYDFSLVFIFFVVFKFYGIYVATIAIMVGSVLQLIETRLYKGYFDRKQITLFVVYLLFGGMTLYFHNPIFIKWKPTVIFWILGIVFLMSQWIGKKTVTQRMYAATLEAHAPIPEVIWKRLNLSWSLFLLALGTVNLFVAYNFTTSTWVNFKLYGVFGAMLVFGFAQSFFITRYILAQKKK